MDIKQQSFSIYSKESIHSPSHQTRENYTLPKQNTSHSEIIGKTKLHDNTTSRDRYFVWLCIQAWCELLLLPVPSQSARALPSVYKEPTSDPRSITSIRCASCCLYISNLNELNLSCYSDLQINLLFSISRMLCPIESSAVKKKDIKYDLITKLLRK